MLRLLPCLLLLLGAAPALAQAPAAPPRGSEIALSPSRFELPIPPGGEETVIVNVISSGGDAEAKPLRLLASLGDWTLTRTGEVTFGKAGSNPRSATPWMLYSPVELAVKPGQTHPIRVTLSVPPDAPPGDHTAVLFVEERPADIRTRTNTKQLVFHLRLAAIFYVMVPPHTTRGELTGLTSGITPRGLEVTPTLHNKGNTHVRPLQSLQLLDASGQVVAELPPGDGVPVLGGAELVQPLVVPANLAPGDYSLRYRVDFRDGSKVVEGRTRVSVPPPAQPAPALRPKG